MTSASMHRTRPGAPARSQRNTASSSGYTPNLSRPPASGSGCSKVQGYLQAASRLALVRLSPKLAPAVVDDLRLEPGEDPQRLGVPLEAAEVLRPVVQRALAVVPERRVPEIVAEARGVDDVGGEPQRGRQLPPDLGHLEGVGEAVAGEVRGARRAQHLGLGRETPECGGMQDPGAIPREVIAQRPVALGMEALGIRLVVSLRPLRCDPDRARSAGHHSVVSRHCGRVPLRRGRRMPRPRARANPASHRAGPDAWACRRDRAGPRRRRRDTAHPGPSWRAAHRSRRGSRPSRAGPASPRRPGSP